MPTTATSELIIRKSIEVAAPIETLWKVLTDAEYIPQYMFGCNAETDWKAGSPLLWRGVADGQVYVKGEVVSIDAPRRLVYTVIAPSPTIPDIPENYLTMIYELQAKGGRASSLEMIQGDYAKVAEGQKRYDETVNGDDFILTAIKKLAEAAA
jgi:uncharacterized protein YndB with AHSA1/START domain